VDFKWEVVRQLHLRSPSVTTFSSYFWIPFVGRSEH
jgi:hypothetical protein